MTTTQEKPMTQEPTISAKYGKKVRGQECDGEFDLTVSLTANAKGFVAVVVHIFCVAVGSTLKLSWVHVVIFIAAAGLAVMLL